MPANFELSGPAFIGIMVRDAEASAKFYEQTLGFRRDPEIVRQGAVAFLSYPIPFAVMEAPEGVDLNSLSRPIRSPIVWFKTANSQVVHDALVAEGVTILRPPSDGRFGRQFMFQDPDGYAINIYDRDAPPAGWEHNR
ncbi:MAG TPA: VOC family protein [Phototrophicaceae bacterium]|jgi:catechol 2,3-dioxygenase-like lactoylglutathione lyase family enzyme|nr:VOC family protein [Phototrophicaceae bacterium]